MPALQLGKGQQLGRLKKAVLGHLLNSCTGLAGFLGSLASSGGASAQSSPLSQQSGWDRGSVYTFPPADANSKALGRGRRVPGKFYQLREVGTLL